MESVLLRIVGTMSVTKIMQDKITYNILRPVLGDLTTEMDDYQIMDV